MRVNYFANRVVNNWNSLPECIVEAGSLNIFKNSLDRLWSNQDLLYNYRGVIEKKISFQKWYGIPNVLASDMPKPYFHWILCRRSEIATKF